MRRRAQRRPLEELRHRRPQLHEHDRHERDPDRHVQALGERVQPARARRPGEDIEVQQPRVADEVVAPQRGFVRDVRQQTRSPRRSGCRRAARRRAPTSATARATGCARTRAGTGHVRHFVIGASLRPHDPGTHLTALAFGTRVQQIVRPRRRICLAQGPSCSLVGLALDRRRGADAGGACRPSSWPPRARLLQGREPRLRGSRP